MALIAEILTKINVDDKKVQPALKKAERGFLKFQKISEKVNRGLKRGLVGITVALTGFTAAMAKATVEIDQLAKTSAKLGVGADALQKLRFQAELTGVSANTLDMALQRMVRRVSEAAAGTGEAKDALKELGLNAQELAKLSPDKQFALIAQAMKRVENQTDKVRLSFKLFDSEGVALVNTLNSDLNETSELFDRLGISITKAQTEGVEQFNDAWAQTKTILKGVTQQIWAGTAPALKVILDRFNNFLKAGGTQQLISGFFDNINAMITQFVRLREGIKFMRADFTDFFEKLDGYLKKAQMGFTNFIESTVGLYKKLRGGLTDVFEKVGQFNFRRLLPFQFGEQVGQPRGSFFTDKAKEALKPTPLPAGTQAGRRPSIELLIKTDPNAAIEILKKDKVVDQMMQTIIREETAKIGK